MPEMDGYEVCRRLKANESTRDIPVIFLTVRNNTGEEARGLALGAVDYISKPFDPAIVQVRIARHLTMRRLHRELEEQNARLAAEIEERKRIEEALRLAKEQAEAADRAKSEFLANMNHELRTPLHAVLGFASLLRESPQTPRNRGYLEIIQSAGRSLLQLIDDILDLSKIEAGKVDLRVQPVDLRTLLQELQTLFGQRAAEHGLGLHVEVAEEVPQALQLDEVRLRQILINLVGNALKFTEQGHVAIRATGQRFPDGRLRLLIEVEDTGIGIPPESQAEIFGLFAQGPGQARGPYGGTGLGLGISQRLAHLMGGEIRLDSAPGRGSNFTLVLSEVRPAELPAAPLPAVQPDSALSFAPADLLIVDDVPSNRSLLVGYLAPYGFSLREAGDGAQALAVVRERPPDLILMDIVMPVLDGLEATRRLKADPDTAAIPVLATCAPLLGERALEIESACDGFLAKPLSKSELVRTLQPSCRTGGGHPQGSIRVHQA
jgi:signal transduction histidine kinase